MPPPVAAHGSGVGRSLSAASTACRGRPSSLHSRSTCTHQGRISYACTISTAQKRLRRLEGSPSLGAGPLAQPAGCAPVASPPGHRWQPLARRTPPVVAQRCGGAPARGQPRVWGGPQAAWWLFSVAQVRRWRRFRPCMWTVHERRQLSWQWLWSSRLTLQHDIHLRRCSAALLALYYTPVCDQQLQVNSHAGVGSVGSQCMQTTASRPAGPAAAAAARHRRRLLGAAPARCPPQSAR